MEGREKKGVGKYEKVKGRIKFEPPLLSFKGLPEDLRGQAGALACRGTTLLTAVAHSYLHSENAQVIQS